MACKKVSDDLVKMFESMDADGNGSLDYAEVKECLKKGNCKLPESQIQAVFSFFDGENGDKRITLDEFKKGIEFLQELINTLCELFKKYDTDKSGFLDKNELRKVLTDCDHKFTDAEIDEIIKNADKSKDGKISCEEFIGCFA